MTDTLFWINDTFGTRGDLNAAYGLLFLLCLFGFGVAVWSVSLFGGRR